MTMRMTITGTNIAANTVVTAVNGNNITLSAVTTGAATNGTALTFGIANQALTVAGLTYNGGSVQALKGLSGGVTTVTSAMTVTTLTRGTNGMLTVISSNLTSDLGTNEKFIPGAALGNTSGILTTPSIVGLGLNDGSLNFLRYVDQRRFDGTVFYRAMRLPWGDQPNGLIQAGTRGDPRRELPPIAHEPTSQTGVLHKAGAISMAPSVIRVRTRFIDRRSDRAS